MKSCDATSRAKAKSKAFKKEGYIYTTYNIYIYPYHHYDPENLNGPWRLVGGWTNPSDKIFVKMRIFPEIGMKIKNI